MTVVIATRIGRSTSKLLMPLAFSAHAGSLLLLTGSPVNILVSEATIDAMEKAFLAGKGSLADVQSSAQVQVAGSLEDLEHATANVVPMLFEEESKKKG